MGFRFTVELKSRRLFHFTYKIFMLSVFIQEFGIALQCVAYAKYALNGIGYPLIKYIGK